MALDMTGHAFRRIEPSQVNDDPTDYLKKVFTSNVHDRGPELHWSPTISQKAQEILNCELAKPEPVRGRVTFRYQIELSRQYPEQFSRVVERSMNEEAEVGSTKVCASLLNGRECPVEECSDAGSLAELWVRHKSSEREQPSPKPNETFPSTPLLHPPRNPNPIFRFLKEMPCCIFP